MEVGAHPPTPPPTPRLCVALLRGTQCSPFTMINAIHRGGTGATLTMPPPLLDCSVPNAPGTTDTRHFCEPPICRVTAGGDGRKGERSRRGHRQREMQEPETQRGGERTAGEQRRRRGSCPLRSLRPRSTAHTPRRGPVGLESSLLRPGAWICAQVPALHLPASVSPSGKWEDTNTVIAWISGEQTIKQCTEPLEI